MWDDGLDALLQGMNADTPSARALLETLLPGSPRKVVSPLSPERAQGYAINVEGLRGSALLMHQNPGKAVVFRLKDTRPMLVDEIAFWADCMAAMVSEMQFDCVTHAPSSGKHPEDEHLATLLARDVAEKLGLPFASTFVNPFPRMHRGSRVTSLRELTSNPFKYVGTPNQRLCIIDDVVFTRSTAMRCQHAAEASGCLPYFLVLYRA